MARTLRSVEFGVERPSDAELDGLSDDERIQRGIGFVHARVDGVLMIIANLEEAPPERRAHYIRALGEAVEMARDQLHAARVRCVQLLHRDLGWSYGQIAELLGISRSRVAQLDALVDGAPPGLVKLR